MDPPLDRESSSILLLPPLLSAPGESAKPQCAGTAMIADFGVGRNGDRGLLEDGSFAAVIFRLVGVIRRIY